MPSTYSTNLGIELPATGEQAGTWGTTTNTNLGTLVEQAVSGYVTQAITDGADTVITIPNGATGVARNMYLELTGTLSAARNLIVPSNKKLYFVYNNTSGGYAVTVKVSGQTGVSVANGQKILLVSNGTDIVAATSYATTGSAITPANPTASVGLSAVNGSASTYMRSDGAPALSQSITPTWTGAHTFSTSVTLNGSVTGTGINDLFGSPPAIGGTTAAAGTFTTVTTTGNIELGNASDTTLARIAAGRASLEGVEIGYRQVPVSSTTTTAVVADVGKCVSITAGLTIPNSTFAAGDSFSIYNNSSGALTITASITTLRLAGSATTGNRTLAQRGMATVWFLSGTEAIIFGAGLS